MGGPRRKGSHLVALVFASVAACSGGVPAGGGGEVAGTSGGIAGTGGRAGAGSAGAGTAGAGTAGAGTTGAGTAGTGTAGTGTAGTGTAGTGIADTGVAGAGVAGTGVAGTGAAGGGTTGAGAGPGGTGGGAVEDPGCYFGTKVTGGADAGRDADADVGTDDGGAGSTGCGFAAFSYPFFDGTERFVLDTDNPAPGGNIAVTGGGAGVTLSWDSSFGSPGHGSLKVDAAFADYNQFLSISLNLATPIDATGKTVHAVLESTPAPPPPLDAAAPEVFTALAQVEVESSDHVISRGAQTRFALEGDLEDVTLPLFSGIPNCADPSRIVRFTLRLSSGAAPSPVNDGGVLPSPAHTTLHILSIRDGTGRPEPGQIDYTFDHDADCFVVDNGNLPPGGFIAGLYWGGGVLLVAAPFTDYDQTVGVHVDLDPFVNLTDKTIYANVVVEEQSIRQSPPTVYFQVQAASGIGLAHAYGPVLAATHGQPMLDLASPSYADPGFDPSQISQIAVAIGSGPAPSVGAVYSDSEVGVNVYAVFAE